MGNAPKLGAIPFCMAIIICIWLKSPPKFMLGNDPFMPPPKPRPLGKDGFCWLLSLLFSSPSASSRAASASPLSSFNSFCSSVWLSSGFSASPDACSPDGSFCSGVSAYQMCRNQGLRKPQLQLQMFAPRLFACCREWRLAQLEGHPPEKVVRLLGVSPGWRQR